jgi:hypothetical protein
MNLNVIMTQEHNNMKTDKEKDHKFLFWTMRSRDRDVVLVRCPIDLGCWEFGMGREWGGDGAV